MVRFTGAREKVADGLASWRGKGMGGGRGRTIEDGTGVPDADGSACEGDQKSGLVVSEDEYMRGSREGSNGKSALRTRCPWLCSAECAALHTPGMLRVSTC